MAQAFLERSFEGTVSDASAARLFVQAALETLGLAGFDDALIVVGELVVNAVLHAKSPFTVTLCRTGDVLRVAVKDGSAKPPAKVVHVLLSPSGRGIDIVDQLATRWGWEPDVAGGKTIWADLRIHP